MVWDALPDTDVWVFGVPNYFITQTRFTGLTDNPSVASIVGGRRDDGAVLFHALCCDWWRGSWRHS